MQLPSWRRAARFIAVFYAATAVLFFGSYCAVGSCSMRRHILLALVIVLSMAVAPVGAAVADPVAQQNNETATPTPTANNSTSTPTNSSGAPTAASQVRITPEKFDEPFLAVSVRESDAAYETTGPFALFTLSREVEAARISQQPASAQVLAGGTQVKVSYADDAAPPGETSLYTLELFFEDGSSKSVELYARQTGVSVGAADLQDYAPVIEELREVSEAHGYGTSPDAMLSYLDWVNERADLIDGFLTKSAAQLMGLAIAASMNWKCRRSVRTRSTGVTATASAALGNSPGWLPSVPIGRPRTASSRFTRASPISTRTTSRTRGWSPSCAGTVSRRPSRRWAR